MELFQSTRGSTSSPGSDGFNGFVLISPCKELQNLNINPGDKNVENFLYHKIVYELKQSFNPF